MGARNMPTQAWAWRPTGNSLLDNPLGNQCRSRYMDASFRDAIVVSDDRRVRCARTTIAAISEQTDSAAQFRFIMDKTLLVADDAAILRAKIKDAARSIG